MIPIEGLKISQQGAWIGLWTKTGWEKILSRVALGNALNALVIIDFVHSVEDISGFTGIYLVNRNSVMLM